MDLEIMFEYIVIVFVFKSLVKLSKLEFYWVILEVFQRFQVYLFEVWP